MTYDHLFEHKKLGFPEFNHNSSKTRQRCGICVSHAICVSQNTSGTVLTSEQCVSKHKWQNLGFVNKHPFFATFKHESIVDISKQLSVLNFVPVNAESC